MTATADQIKAALEIMLTVARAIEEVKRIPSGHLYATMCGHLSLSAFESMVRQLVGTGMVRRCGHELVWVG